LVAADFLRGLIQATPYKIRTVLTDKAIHFTKPSGDCRQPISMIIFAPASIFQSTSKSRFSNQPSPVMPRAETLLWAGSFAVVAALVLPPLFAVLHAVLGAHAAGLTALHRPDIVLNTLLFCALMSVGIPAWKCPSPWRLAFPATPCRKRLA
jgi:hypothetical protein